VVGTIAITGVNVVDVESGRVLRHRTVVIEANRIREMGSADSIRPPAGAMIVDGDGGFLIPGLWDMHVHLATEANVPLELFPAFGVTSVRDVGGPLADLVRLRELLRSGQVRGPRLFMCGPVMDGQPPSWPAAALVVESREDARMAVDHLAGEGVDCIKAYDRIGAEALTGLVEEAAAHRLPVLIHPPARMGVRRAAELGVRGVEHLHLGLPDLDAGVGPPGAGAPMLWDRQAALWAVFGSDVRANSLIEVLAERGVFLSPTLNIDASNHYVPDAEQARHPDNRVLPANVARDWSVAARNTAVPVSPDAYDQALAGLATRRAFVATAAAAGVPLLAGSGGPWLGTYVPGLSLHRELELLVEAGASPLEALRSATLHAAAFFEASDSLGRVAPGSIADLVLLEGNPLSDIRNTRQIRGVVLNGEYIGEADRDPPEDPMAMALSSPAFGPNEAIPSRHTCDGADASPALSWTGVPDGARSLALIVDCPDPAHPRMTWVHWVLYNIPPTAGGLAEGVGAAGLPPGTLEGRNDWKEPGYRGPCPPRGRHRYFHKLYALDTVLPDLRTPTKADLERAMEGRIVGRAELVGTYEGSR
jgi:Raf kinase inhibitor-like YbhB/YbcL family protein